MNLISREIHIDVLEQFDYLRLARLQMESVKLLDKYRTLKYYAVMAGKDVDAVRYQKIIYTLEVNLDNIIDTMYGFEDEVVSEGIFQDIYQN